ncbi:MAG TPA: HAD-IA family hydrolase [Actinophytocola sp.]|uniref:HAD-IA family hydrolase n=1 Tax=Actinophytocola sp. TaxID=1872138 RepID=UPI002DBDD60C|nr:HAD-IA family hydrolase [Actinophytocola sp.]HEU5473554.1 HAD-IA family hydrolase [Actinophytocola sp.]
MTPPSPITAVIFDLDGVLVDSFAVMRQAFETAYAEVVGGDRPPFEDYRRHLGRYFPDIMRIMGLPAEMEEPFVRESQRLAHQVRIYDGVPAMLGLLRTLGVPTAVATGKSGPRARSLLGQLGLLRRFDAVIGSDEVRRPKPAPDIVERALAVLAVPASAAVMVGDAVTDMRSAQSAGVRAAAAVWGEGEEADLVAANPDMVLRHPMAVPMLVRSRAA